MSRPFFTVITPTLNAERHLRDCVASLERQSLTDWEHVFIDACSTDDTLHILEEYRRTHPQKVSVFQYPKAGIADAFNKGILHARGRYLNFLGSDDLLEDDALRIVHAQVEHRQPRWCYGHVKRIDDWGEVTRAQVHGDFAYARLLTFHYICHQAVFTRDDVFTDYGLFDAGLRYAMDHEYFLRIGRKEAPLRIDAFVCRFREGQHNTTSVQWRDMLREKRRVNCEYGSLLERQRSRVAYLATYAWKLAAGRGVVAAGGGARQA